MNIPSSEKQGSIQADRRKNPRKIKRSPQYFYLTSFAVATAFIIPAALVQNFVIFDGSLILEGKLQWQLFLMPAVVITIAGFLLGRIQLLKHLLEQSNDSQQRDILNNSPSAIYIKDLDGRYLFINKMFETIFHVSNNAVNGCTDSDLFPATLAATLHNNDIKVIETGTSLEFDEIVKHDGEEHTYISTKFPLTNTSGDIYAICGISTDITERVSMETALRRSQKMDAIGQLSGGIAHDFNNQLGVIIGYLDFLKSHVANDKEPLRWIEIASRSTQRCIDLTQQLLMISRNKLKKTDVVNLNTIFKDLDHMLSRSITPEVEIQYFFTENLWSIEIDSGEFQDVILNLVINARDAMPDGGKLLIETNNITTDSTNNGMQAGDYVQIILSDTGTGMDKETQEHAYDPFFTTKPAGKGTGLGLSMVYGFIQRYDGYIKVYSELGVGTSFHLYLPRTTATESTSEHINIQDIYLPIGNESILIVDDETDLLDLAAQYLSELGYHVHKAKSAAQALEILSNNEDIDLLFSDVVMPGGMNGYELAQQSTQLRPNLQVLLTSGFTSKTIAKNSLAKFSANLLNKPYQKIDLAQRIRLVLD